MVSERERDEARRARRLARERATKPEQETPARGSSAVRTKPVRVTVDFDPNEFRALDRATAEIAQEMGLSVDALGGKAEVLRALARMLVDRAGTRALILDHLRPRRPDLME